MPAPALRLVNSRTGAEIAAHLTVANSPLRRMRGLLGRSALARGEGLRIEPTSAIHTWFMRFPIDLLFVDGEDRVLRCVHALPPFRFAAARGARAVIELPAGTLVSHPTHPGDALEVRPAEREAAA